MGCGDPRRNFGRPSWPCLLLLTICIHVMAALAQVLPVSMLYTTDWYGDDGQWGAIYVAVGSDPQTLVVFPNTVGADFLVVDGDGGCENISATDCASERGGLFDTENSTTWDIDGGYREANYNGIGTANLYADYGTDYITFDFSTGNNSSAPTNNSTSTVATFNSTDNWIGYLGLNPTRSDLSDLDSLPFMLNVWINRTSSPSCSYGYTAGAYYRLKGVPASLTIGGYDQARFVPNDVSFELSLQGLPVVSLASIQGLSVTNDNNTSSTILIETYINSYFTLDSSTSYIWLPESTCDMFSEQLNLTYDEKLDLYTYGNDTTIHDRLASSNISFTFSLTDDSSSSEVVNITLPFAAFDHAITYPYPGFYLNDTSQSIPYFPIKRASSSDEYRIGRVFFQEAYLIVDYERGNFSVSQNNWDSSVINEINIITIGPEMDYPENQPKKLSKGATAGIVVGSLVGFALLLLVLWWFFLRKRYVFISCLRRREPKSKDPDNKEQGSNSQLSFAPRRLRNWLYRGRAEVAGDYVQPSELSGADTIHELPGSTPGYYHQVSTTASKEGLRRSTTSATQSSIVSFRSSTRMSFASSDGSVEEELISPYPTSRPSSITKRPFPSTDTTAVTNNEHETGSNRSSRVRPGKIVLGPTSPTHSANSRSES